MANTTSLSFVDVDGNPLPAGVQVSVQSSGSLVASGFTQVDGVLPVNLAPSTVCSAAFFGTLAPPSSVSFTTSAISQTINVPNYCSPVASASGYAARQTSVWARGWFGDSARVIGGGAYAIAAGAGAELHDLSTQNQGATLNARLQSSDGSDVDAWFQDYFGTSLPRFSGESDATYIARGMAALAAKMGVRAGILVIADFFGTAWINEPWLASETGAYDQPGTLAYDTIGGYGSQSPLIQVFVQPSGIATNAQMKAAIVAARGCGINIQVVSVATVPGFTLGTSSLGVGTLGDAGYAGTIL
jgi:hypothetical protein